LFIRLLGRQLARRLEQFWGPWSEHSWQPVQYKDRQYQHVHEHALWIHRPPDDAKCTLSVLTHQRRRQNMGSQVLQDRSVCWQSRLMDVHPCAEHSWPTQLASGRLPPSVTMAGGHGAMPSRCQILGAPLWERGSASSSGSALPKYRWNNDMARTPARRAAQNPVLIHHHEMLQAATVA